MAELHLYGYLGKDDAGLLCLGVKKPNKINNFFDYSVEFFRINVEVEDFAKNHGIYNEYEDGLGGIRAILDNCNLRLYFTNKKCELEEAMMALDMFMFGGLLETNLEYEGYSEYTITGYDLSTFSIGGHSLFEEFSSHLGQYCHMIIEV